MKKFIITADVFTGEVHVVYDADNKFGAVDFLSAEITKEQTEWIYSRLPMVYSPEAFKARLNATNIIITEQRFEITFDMFWDVYGHKVNRKRCERIWGRYGSAKKLKAYNGVRPYKNHLAVNTWKTQADPETYLNNEYWETDWSKVR